jgi:hypothetical protein
MYALEDEDNNVVHSKRHYVLVGEYAQNLAAPHFGGPNLEIPITSPF